ncbi:hypothetical protein NP534_17405 [Pseudomonas sp. 39004]|uniref:hypothetical protein n=1 Tax=Pseudomonas sp. 39004 TaxID=2967213 RepID=UPI00236361B3|nr:hypothetical protein [Pseudomonas sp. 39004]MDD1961890.1 hypothetical protein [Pseudomonas sp. 39004]
MDNVTVDDVARWLAIEQVKHYEAIKQSASTCGDKSDYRRCVDQIDILITKYGLKLIGGEYK